jgi:hypothetical protein
MTAFQILNISIDTDALFTYADSSIQTQLSDDVDSVTELLVESISDNSNLTSETDDDRNNTTSIGKNTPDPANINTATASVIHKASIPLRCFSKWFLSEKIHAGYLIHAKRPPRNMLA